MLNRKYHIYILAACLAGAASCKKAIDIQPVGQNDETAIHSEADLFSALNYGYNALSDDKYYGGLYQAFNELPADHMDGVNLGGFYFAVYNRNVTIFNSDVSDLYATISKPILQANQVLDTLGLASTANRANLQGQAKFLRSLSLFDMVRMYAQPYVKGNDNSQPGVPLRLTAARQKVTRQTVAQVYQRIVQDLRDAENLLPATNNSYATKWAAKALLAKVYFQMNDFANAYSYADQVISGGGFGFDGSYNARYSPSGSTETVFGLTYEKGFPTSRFQLLHNNYYTQASALPALRIAKSFYDQATSNANDARKAWYTTKTGFYLLNKFDSASFKVPVIHITELKLIRAESAAELNSNLNVAIQDVNDIMTRAYGAASPLLLPANAGAVQISDAARRERDLELVGEGNRLQELKRRGGKGEPATIRSSPYNCPGLIFPFPTNEVSYNGSGFVQNPSGGCN